MAYLTVMITTLKSTYGAMREGIQMRTSQQRISLAFDSTRTVSEF
ncbi:MULTISPECIES: hypothetical protein [unclassified Pseudomonas]|nr:MULTISPECIES: hypothetical protein [unclassified Pseudomonas]